ncbi:MAG TPA: hypothetical protein VHK91_03830 [Flavisolibacter sp.]|jgi:hypothetical protein|nr:hypothetical protein [Flavisolibacter sp.]
MIKVLSTCVLFVLSLSAYSQTKTVKQLYDEYRQNKSEFESRYRNQTVTVTGKIRSISRVSEIGKDQDVHRVYLTATGYENFVVCELPYKDTAILNSLKAGNVVTVTGRTRSPISDAVYLTDCSFGNAQPIAVKSTAPDNAPLGKYNVYQDDGSGFNFQYTLYLNSYTSYTLNGKTGSCAYNPKTKAITFSTGSLKGFAGLYRKTTDNEKDPPGFLLNAKGTIPNEKGSHHGYQFAYYQDK